MLIRWNVHLLKYQWVTMLIGWNVQMYRPFIKLSHSRRCVFLHVVLVECVSPLANANPVSCNFWWRNSDREWWNIDFLTVCKLFSFGNYWQRKEFKHYGRKFSSEFQTVIGVIKERWAWLFFYGLTCSVRTHADRICNFRA